MENLKIVDLSANPLYQLPACWPYSSKRCPPTVLSEDPLRPLIIAQLQENIITNTFISCTSDNQYDDDQQINPPVDEHLHTPYCSKTPAMSPPFNDFDITQALIEHTYSVAMPPNSAFQKLIGSMATIENGLNESTSQIPSTFDLIYPSLLLNPNQ